MCLRLVPPWDWTAFIPCPIKPLTHPNARARGTGIEWNALWFSYMQVIFGTWIRKSFSKVFFLMTPRLADNRQSG